MAVKSFVYLDDYKMFSASSQIFEGLTDRIIRHESEEETETEQQKGPFASGEVMADIASRKNGVTEHRFLHDYAYTLFEDKIEDLKIVTKIDKEIDGNWQELIRNSKFVKVTGKALFNDMERISSILENFNKSGLASAYVTNIESITNAKNAKKIISSVKDRGVKENLQQIIDSGNIQNIAEKAGLNFDKEFLDHLRYLLDFGYSGAFEVRLRIKADDQDVVFSSIINRNYLREKENDLIWKYARHSQKEFTIFGAVTQMGFLQPEESPKIADMADCSSIKEATLNMMEYMIGIEKTFVSLSPNEIVIDPIAIYREI